MPATLVLRTFANHGRKQAPPIQSRFVFPIWCFVHCTITEWGLLYKIRFSKIELVGRMFSLGVEISTDDSCLSQKEWKKGESLGLLWVFSRQSLLIPNFIFN